MDGNIVRQSINFNGLANPFVQTYKYDSLDRITEAKETVNGGQTWIQQFGYDRYGNRTSLSEMVHGQAKPINEITLPSIDANTNRFSSTTDYDFDAVGNLIRDAQGKEFTFNGDNKQVEVKDDQEVTLGEYLYDGNGKRVKKITDDEYVVFVYDGFGKLVAEFSTDGPPQNPGVSYTATDPLGSPRVLTNAYGHVVSRRDFMPFGEEVAADPTYRTSALKYGVADKVRQKFTGYERDAETGLDFAEARYYYNNHGRFTAVDPLLGSGKSGNPQTFNRYAYVMNRPLILNDPTGLQAGKMGPHYEDPPTPSSQLRVKVNSVKIFTGTFPNNASMPEHLRGQKAATTTGTAMTAQAGAYVSVDYSLDDSRGKPVKGVEVKEDLDVRISTIEEDPDTGEVGVETRSSKLRGGSVSDKPTDENGRFTDEPLGGGSAATPVTSLEITQTLYYEKDGKRHDLVTNTLKATTDVRLDPKTQEAVGTRRTTVVFTSGEHKTEIKDLPLRRREN